MSSAVAAPAGGAHRVSGVPAGARRARPWLWCVAAGVLWAVALAFGVAGGHALVVLAFSPVIVVLERGMELGVDTSIIILGCSPAR